VPAPAWHVLRTPDGAAAGAVAPPPPPSRTKWTRLVHPSVLTGHVSRRRQVLVACGLEGACEEEAVAEAEAAEVAGRGMGREEREMVEVVVVVEEVASPPPPPLPY
jgi:hypothetical protein